jgi:hypothetical protein
VEWVRIYRLNQVHQDGPKMDKSGYFVGHISHYPLYIFAHFKMWDGREHHGLQSDGLGLFSKRSVFRFVLYSASGNGVSLYFDLITCTERSVASLSMIIHFG